MIIFVNIQTSDIVEKYYKNFGKKLCNKIRTQMFC